VAGALLRAALVASCFLGALPPVDLRAVCFVRAISTQLIPNLTTAMLANEDLSIMLEKNKLQSVYIGERLEGRALLIGRFRSDFDAESDRAQFRSPTRSFSAVSTHGLPSMAERELFTNCLEEKKYCQESSLYSVRNNLTDFCFAIEQLIKVKFTILP
jgi:hypothetical protein